MKIKQKEIIVPFKASYYTLGDFSENTNYLWLVCHGYGQLAKYFTRRFDFLNPKEHFIIAPEGLSKFYLKNDYQKVGASWLTKEEREIHLENQLQYLEQLYLEEVRPKLNGTFKVVLFGFSQGVATITRWANHSKIPFDTMILWAGSLPTELKETGFSYLDSKVSVHLVIGKEDHYSNFFRINEQIVALEKLLGKPTLTEFEGGHEVRRDVLKTVLKSF